MSNSDYENSDDEDESMFVASERHAQLMADLAKFFNRLAWGMIGIIVVIIGAVVFFFIKR